MKEWLQLEKLEATSQWNNKQLFRVPRHISELRNEAGLEHTPESLLKIQDKLSKKWSMMGREDEDRFFLVLAISSFIKHKWMQLFYFLTIQHLRASHNAKTNQDWARPGLKWAETTVGLACALATFRVSGIN